MYEHGQMDILFSDLNYVESKLNTNRPLSEANRAIDKQAAATEAAAATV